MFCRHSSSLVSVNGYFTCQKCFQLVKHPWAPTVVQRTCTTITGIERVQREEESADKKLMREMGVKC